MPLLKWTLRNVLNALSFLHDEEGVVHTGRGLNTAPHSLNKLTKMLDINPRNIILTVADETILEDFEKDEAANPSPEKIIDDTRSIYASRKLRVPRDEAWGQPVLCDFGAARIGEGHEVVVQPKLYRAPEVLFEMDWGVGVDIWSLGVLVSIHPSQISRELW